MADKRKPQTALGRIQEPLSVEYADLLGRAYALLIDGSILLLMLVISFIVYSVGNAIGSYTASELAGISVILLCVFSFLYFPYFESSEKQATPGKEAAGIIVTDKHGRRISFARAVARNLLKWLASVVSIIPIAASGKKQGVHDMMAGTLVVVKKKNEELRKKSTPAVHR